MSLALRTRSSRSGIWRTIAHQSLHCNDLPEPLFGRLREMTTPAAIRRNIILDRAHRGDLRTIADVEVIIDPDFGPQRHVVANGQAACQTDLGGQEAAPADRHVVADLDLIVD